jgi:NH3-dependent NAD+ synthetase
MDYTMLADEIAGWMRGKLREAQAQGFVLGLSGGVDSATVAALCKRAAGDEVLGVWMPCYSVPEDEEFSRMVAEGLGINLRTVDLCAAYDALLEALPAGNKMARANLKPRLRMSTVYYLAQSNGYLVAGTGNKPELKVGYFCYDERTRALTTDGLRDYRELKPGDSVLSLEMSTGHVIESAVAGVYAFEYDGDMLAYGGKPGSKIDLMVTPNHRMLIERSNGPEYCRADRLPRRSTPTPTPRPWRGTQVPASAFVFDNDDMGTDERRFAPMPMKEFLYLLGLYIGYGHAQAASIVQPSESAGRPPREPETGRSRTKRAEAGSKECAGYRTWFALPEATKSRGNLVALLEKNSIAFGETKTQVWVCGRPFFRAMEACGTSAHTKHIPSWVLGCPAEYLEELVFGLMGSDRDQCGCCHTVSERLAEQALELGCKLGRNVSFRTREPRTATRSDGVETHMSRSYEVSVQAGGRHWINAAKFRRIPFRGTVWCPEVPGARNLLVERNGRFLFCGNTKYGDGGVDLEPLGELYKHEVRALAGVLGVPQPIIDRAPSPGLWPGQTDEGEMGVTYAEIDAILAALEVGQPPNLPADRIAKVEGMIARSAHKRAMPPSFQVKR